MPDTAFGVCLYSVSAQPQDCAKLRWYRDYIITVIIIALGLVNNPGAFLYLFLFKILKKRCIF